MAKKSLGKIKQPSKGTLTRKLDVIVSRIVRSRGQCVFCGLSDYSKLQCAHIYSRKFRNTRWDFKNVLCLCAGCHMGGHSNPIDFVEKVRQHIGEHEYELLKHRHNAIKKWSAYEMQELLKTLEHLESKLYE